MILFIKRASEKNKTMNIFISTLFPLLYTEFLRTSLIKKALENNILTVSLLNMFDFIPQKKRIDAPIVGHGAGVLIGAPVVQAVVEHVREKSASKKPFTIFFSPHGKLLDQKNLQVLLRRIQDADNEVLLVSGRYEGFDVRAEEEYADEVVSIGNYVLCGGDLPVMVFVEAISRLIEGVVGDKSSVEHDSFSGGLVDFPHYAAPEIWKERKIPEILKSGNHQLVDQWRLEKSIERTISKHWKWLTEYKISQSLKRVIAKKIPHHYCALLHNDIVLKDGSIGNSTVTSTDIHDIARASKTYGIIEYFIITRITAQQELANRFLDFWNEEEAQRLNPSRASALAFVSVKKEIKDCVEYIYEKEGKLPLIIVTSSRRETTHECMITFHDQERVWKEDRPVLFIFGTSHGISVDIMNECDYRLIPIEGLEEFNFLSVRSAVGIVLDRWLGFNYY